MEKKNSYILGLIGALLGAIIGAIPWAAAYYFGWFVGWLGFLIGFFASKGYDLLGGKQSKGKAPILILSAIVGVFIGQLLGDFVTLAVMISKDELNGFIYADIPLLYYTLLTLDSELFTSTLTNLGIGLLFAGLGMWKMIVNILKPPAPAADVAADPALPDIDSVADSKGADISADKPLNDRKDDPWDI